MRVNPRTTMTDDESRHGHDCIEGPGPRPHMSPAAQDWDRMQAADRALLWHMAMAIEPDSKGGYQLRGGWLGP